MENQNRPDQQNRPGDNNQNRTDNDMNNQPGQTPDGLQREPNNGTDGVQAPRKGEEANSPQRGQNPGEERDNRQYSGTNEGPDMGDEGSRMGEPGNEQRPNPNNPNATDPGKTGNQTPY